MFREGQYLEVIKASNNCLATAVVTVQEKSMKIREKNVSTNKWLDLEDWAALYTILEKAILRNVKTQGSLRNLKECKWKKSTTRHLEVTYTFEPAENAKDSTLLPVIRVHVSPAKRKSELLKTSAQEESRGLTTEKIGKISNDTSRKDANDNSLPKKSRNRDSLPSDTKNNRKKRYLPIDSAENNVFEEYVPDAPATKKLCANLNYIPSRKSTLEQIQISSNEYSPSVSSKNSATEMFRYIPNSVSEVSYEKYEPSGTSAISHSEEYIPNSKGSKASVEEYHPDFTSKAMKFDDSYVPSSVKLTNKHSKRFSERHKRLQLEKHASRATLTKK